MGKYINEEAKVGIHWILVIWDEKRQTNSGLPIEQQLLDTQLLPSFSEYDKDPRSPKANSLAQHFGSYADAVKAARYYDTHRDELKPAKVVPASVTKPRSNTKRVARKGSKQPPQATKPAISASKPISDQATKPTPPTQITPQKAPEPPSTPKPEPVTDPKPKTQPAAPQAAKPFGSIKDNGGVFRIPQKKRKESSHITLTQSIGDLIPEEFLKLNEEQALPPAPEPEIEAVASSEAEAPTPSDNVKLVNYFFGKIAFISEDFYRDFHESKFRLGSNYLTLPREENAYAATSARDYDEIEIDSSEGQLYVPITTDDYTSPYLVKDGRVRSFPDPTPGQILLVERRVAEAAKANGRSTDDLVFPKRFIRTFNGVILCVELGKL